MSNLNKYLKLDTSYLLSNGSWLMGGYIVTALCILLSSYVFANHLTPTVYGQYKYLISLGVILTSLSLTGLHSALTQGTAKGMSGLYTFISKLDLKFEIPILIVGTVGAIYYYINNDTYLAIGLLCVALLQPILNNSNLIYSHLLGHNTLSKYTFAHTCRTAFVTIILIILVFYFNDPLILITGYFISNIAINYCIKLFIIPDNSNIKDVKSLDSLIRYAKHSSVRNLFPNIANQVDKILIFQNLNAVELAIYSFAIALPDQFKSITKAINTLLLPRFTKHSQLSLKDGMLRKTLIYIIFLLLLVLIYILLAPLLYNLIFPEYQEAIYLSQVFSLTTLFAIAGLPTAALQAQMRNKELYRLDIIVAVMQTILIILFFTMFGLIGVIWGRILGRVTNTIYAFWLFYKL
jgi:O-antigen/teichoic acid export membrane protein